MKNLFSPCWHKVISNIFPSSKGFVSSTRLPSCNHTCYVRSFSDAAVFKPKKILILTKISRYAFEKRNHPELTEKQLENLLSKRGSDYNLLLYHHYIHKGIENTVDSVLRGSGIETKVVSRLDYTEDKINWADAIVTTGGDGTFLLAATRVLNNKKPIIGFNSDPTKSKGHLCLAQKYSVDVREAIDKLLKGDFRWTYRTRIRVTLIGETIFDPPVELHNQKLRLPENRYLDIDPQLGKAEPVYETEEGRPMRVLPVLALNEVFIGECVSARVSYLELSMDGKNRFKQKCSGLLASTGTGSTSWTYSINKLTDQTLGEILTLIKEETGVKIKDSDPLLVKKITNKFNELLIINPGEPRMVYTIRDPLSPAPLEKLHIKPRGFAHSLAVKSRCFDANLVIDGGMSFKFNDGTKAKLEVFKDDSLRTVTLREQPTEVTFKH